MLIYTIDQLRRAAGLDTRMGRREFFGSTLGAICAALPASHLWADASSPGAIPRQLAAFTLDGKPIALTASDIKDFRASLKGQLLLAQDPGYDSARRLANPAFDRHPRHVRDAGPGRGAEARRSEDGCDRQMEGCNSQSRQGHGGQRANEDLHHHVRGRQAVHLHRPEGCASHGREGLRHHLYREPRRRPAASDDHTRGEKQRLRITQGAVCRRPGWRPRRAENERRAKPPTRS